MFGQIMARPLPRLAAQFIVLIPTLAVTFWLQHAGVGVFPRMLAGLSVGMILIMLVALWQRRAS